MPSAARFRDRTRDTSRITFERTGSSSSRNRHPTNTSTAVTRIDQGVVSRELALAEKYLASGAVYSAAVRLGGLLGAGVPIETLDPVSRSAVFPSISARMIIGPCHRLGC